VPRRRPTIQIVLDSVGLKGAPPYFHPQVSPSAGRRMPFRGSRWSVSRAMPTFWAGSGWTGTTPTRSHSCRCASVGRRFHCDSI